MKRKNSESDDAELKCIEAAKKAIRDAYWRDFTNLPSVWVARDEDGELWLYNQKPVKACGMFHCGICGEMMPIDDQCYPEISYDNSPIKIRLLFVEV